MKKNGTIAALDIGSSKIACFIARHENGQLSIKGIGHQLAQGYRGGIVTDVKLLETSILLAVSAAEEMAGETVEKIIISVSGTHIGSTQVVIEQQLGIDSISEKTLVRMIETAKENFQDNQHQMIHCLPTGYSLDGAAGITDPRGMYGGNLEASMHIVTCAKNPLKNVVSCVSECHLDIENMVASSYASGLSALTENEMESGVVLIEIGGALTSFAVFNNGNMLFTRTLPIGGITITSDIAKVLSTPYQSAERLKVMHGSLITGNGDTRENIEVTPNEDSAEDGARYISRAMLSEIIKPRIEEIFEMICEELETAGFVSNLPPRIVLTGGTSQLTGIDEFAARYFEANVRIGRPKFIKGLAESVGTAPFTTCAGLLTFAATESRINYIASYETAPKGVKSIFKWFAENF